MSVVLCREDGAVQSGPGVIILPSIGRLRGLDSERGIAWRAADSSGVRAFLGVGLDAFGDGSPDDFADAAD